MTLYAMVFGSEIVPKRKPATKHHMADRNDLMRLNACEFVIRVQPITSKRQKDRKK